MDLNICTIQGYFCHSDGSILPSLQEKGQVQENITEFVLKLTLWKVNVRENYIFDQTNIH